MENGVTPLHLAAEWNKVDLVESLLKRGLGERYNLMLRTCIHVPCTGIVVKAEWNLS